MSFGKRFGGFYGGASLSSLVPGTYPVSLNGRPYPVDLSDGSFKQRTVALLRTQADQSNLPSEQSINPEDLWRRSQESWDHGAGQTNYDRPNADNARFRSSKGVDVWTKWQLSLLPDTVQRLSSANTNLAVVSAGSRLYAVDGAALKWTTDLSTWTSVTSMSAVASTSVASDGFNVWTANGSDGIYATNRGTGAASQLVTTGLDSTAVVGYVKGRLMVGWKNALYNIVSASAAALPTALFTQSNTDFVWVGFAEGQGQLYAAGYSGDKSLIYRTAVKSDGTALDAPVVAGELPDGEIVRAVQGYLGFIVIGSDLGVRLASADSAGNLTIGSLIPTSSPVRCFEPQDRFVWFGMENYDGTSTGLGRLDLTVFVGNLTPAYASDLMVTGQGHVTSAASFAGKRVLAVAGLGVYQQSTTLVAAGTIDSGVIRFGLGDAKIAMSLDVVHEPLVYGSHSAYLAVDSGPFRLIGTHTVGSAEGRFSCGQQSGEKFEVRLELDRDGSITTAGPTLTRATLFAEPAPSRSYLYTVPLLLDEMVLTPQGNKPQDVVASLADIVACVASKQMVAFQIGDTAMPVFVKDFEFDRRQPTKDRSGWQGVCKVLLKVPSSS